MLLARRRSIRALDVSELKIMNIGKRIELSKQLGGITARIKTRKNIFLLIFLPIWLTGWTFGGIAAITAVLIGTNETGFLIFWLCGWFIGETFAISAWLWNACGQEVVSINRGLFEYKRELFGQSITKKSIPIKELSNLRAAGVYGSMWSFGHSMSQWGFGGGVVAVDQGWETYRFGIGLEEKEAMALVAELKPYLPETSDNSFNRSAR
jgi:hypothetical protein